MKLKDKEYITAQDVIDELGLEKKPNYFLHSIVRSFLYISVCIFIMIYLDNNVGLKTNESWFIGWMMAIIYAHLIQKRR